ncbi:flagellar hook-associated protein 3 [Candidatus Poribacteria bacterium]|nr:MAG: flagellar hook-associated protein 3 [Candidatus Poribacteria bacterium]
MRVSQRVVNEELRASLQRCLCKLQEAIKVTSSGKRIELPSDDPEEIDELLGYKIDLRRSEQMAKDAQNALTFLNTTETILNQVEGLLGRLKEIAVMGASDTLNDRDRAALAEEVKQIKEELVRLANTSVAGQHIFAGTATTAPPYQVEGDRIVYKGNSGAILRQIGPNETIQINLPGDEVFGTEEGGLLATVAKLEENLRDGNVGAVREAISELDEHHETVLAARAKVGSLTERVKSALEAMDELIARLKEFISQIEEEDLAEAAMKLAEADNAYKASLLAAARILGISIIDLLG